MEYLQMGLNYLEMKTVINDRLKSLLIRNNMKLIAGIEF
jgi:hypothetical protein